MLDLVISNFTSPVGTSIMPRVGKSDQSSVLAGFSIPIFRGPKTARRVWRYQPADWPRLRHFYSTTDWETLISPVVLDYLGVLYTGHSSHCLFYLVYIAHAFVLRTILCLTNSDRRKCLRAPRSNTTWCQKWFLLPPHFRILVF